MRGKRAPSAARALYPLAPPTGLNPPTPLSGTSILPTDSAEDPDHEERRAVGGEDPAGAVDTRTADLYRGFVVFVYRVPAKSPATGLQVRRIPADTWACGRRDSATIRIRSVPSGIRGMPAAFRSWSRRTLNCGRSGIAGSSEANIFRDNSTRRAGRVAGKRPRSPRTDRKDAAGVLDVRPAKPMVGKGAGHVRRRSMKRMQRRFRPRVRTAVGPST